MRDPLSGMAIKREVKRYSKHWFREFLRARFREGQLVPASVRRYLPYKKLSVRFLGSHRQKMINEVATEFEAILIYGRRGGLWSAVYALPNMELNEELSLRVLGEQVRPGYNEQDRRQVHRQRNWYIRHWRGRPFLCIRIPREKRWYDVRGYLVK